jgi:hypothetical protein
VASPRQGIRLPTSSDCKCPQPHQAGSDMPAEIFDEPEDASKSSNLDLLSNTVSNGAGNHTSTAVGNHKSLEYEQVLGI